MKPLAHWAPPAMVEEFELGRPLGRGGMGQVYAARDTVLGREVALKFLAELDPASNARLRFAAEARAIARLSHPNVAGIYRIGEFEQRPFLVYELVNGKPLSALILPLDWRTVLSLASDLCAGLAAIHRAGLVHRDIKPANLMLDDNGTGKVIDFGLARLRHDSFPPLLGTDDDSAPEHHTRDGTLVGTPAFIAPEVWSGSEADARSDLFAFGLVLRELLLGESARRHGTSQALAEGARRGFGPLKSERPDLPASFAQLIDRCLRVLPFERSASAEALLPELTLLRDVLLGAHLAAPVESLEADAVAASFARVWSRKEEFIVELYRRLFERHPEFRQLFPADLKGQHKKLLHALRLTVEGLRSTERIAAHLVELGRTHVSYGVSQEQLSWLGPVLLGTLGDFDAEFSPEVEAAWTKAWQFLQGAMSLGYQLSGETALTQETRAYQPQTQQSERPPPRTQQPRTLQSENPPPRTQQPRTLQSEKPPSVPVLLPSVHYVERDETSVAWASTGDVSAPRTLLFLPPFLTHLELVWREPAYAHFLKRLSEFGRVLRFDRRGTGLSERGAVRATSREQALDAVAVLDAAGVGRVSLLAASESAFLAIALAALHPERVEALVLVDALACARQQGDFAHGVAAQTEQWLVNELAEKWAEPTWLGRLAPTRADDPSYAAWLGEFLRNTISPRHARVGLQTALDEDVRELCPQILAPTLVIHRTGDPCVAESAVLDLANRIPDAAFVVVPGRDHLLHGDGSEGVLEEAQLFFEAHS